MKRNFIFLVFAVLITAWLFFSIYVNMKITQLSISSLYSSKLLPDQSSVRSQKEDSTTKKFQSQAHNRPQSKPSILPLETWANSEELPKALPYTAYLEPKMEYWVPDKEGTFGKPITPLPLRTVTPASLRKHVYEDIQSCADLPHQLPVDRSPDYDKQGNPIPFRNVKRTDPIKDPIKELPYCPVDADPFLPWIHDVFPSKDGKKVQIVAQNKRRCNGSIREFDEEIERLEPQVSLLQGVSVVEVMDNDYISKDLWEGGDDYKINNDDNYYKEKRWKLTTLEKIEEYEKIQHDDGRPEMAEYTRFICRFKAIESPNSKVQVIGETLSEFPVNYELANKRKAIESMISKKEKDQRLMWLSSYTFDCPVPSRLQEAIRKGQNVFEKNNVALFYLDIVPIRTPPRLGIAEGLHLPPELGYPTFDAKMRWGENHVLPKLEASGRLENIPICKSPAISSNNSYSGNKHEEIGTEIATIENNEDNETNEEGAKQHDLVGCVWASSSYTTRNDGLQVSDTNDRMIEWIEYHLLAGMDHIYIYDNSKATVIDPETEPNFTDLSFIKEYFPSDKVTYIDWPFRICNNNFPQHKNPGERSSQYAAETSCRIRYGPDTEWIINLDTDEYLFPNLEKYKDLKEMLIDVKKGGTNILGFRSARNFMNVKHAIPYFDGDQCGKSSEKAKCLKKSPTVTFLQAYNCDKEGSPKVNGYTRAKKQIYRPEYVASHFVHYTVITKPMLSMKKMGVLKYEEREPSERFINEEKEGYMIHAKTWRFTETLDWRTRCLEDHVVDKFGTNKCLVGIPYPLNDAEKGKKVNADGFLYNSYQREDVENIWVPRLEKAMGERRRKYDEAKTS